MHTVDPAFIKKTFIAIIILSIVKSHHTSIRIDLGKVTTVDSSGIAMFISFYQRNLNARRKIALLNASEDVKRIFRMLNVDRFLNVV